MENNKFKCYECNHRFSDSKTVFAHLKHVHMVKEKVSQLKCINFFDFYKCDKIFLTFAGLRNHLNKCISTGKEFELMVIKFSPLSKYFH